MKPEIQATTQVKIKTTQQCPECGGEGEVGNPEYAEMGVEYEAWRKALGRFPTPTEDNTWQDNYWLSKGYTHSDPWDGTPGLVTGPWDVARCGHCDGTGTEVRSRYIGLVELSQMMGAAVALHNNAYVHLSEREVVGG